MGEIENIDFVRCQICGLKRSHLKTHIPRVHKISTQEYRKSFPNSLVTCEKTVEKRVRLFKSKPHPLEGKKKSFICILCKHKFKVPLSAANVIPICYPCRDEIKRSENNELWKDRIPNKEFVECKLCGWKERSLINHIRIHKIKAKEYREKFNSDVICEDFRKEISERHTGRKHSKETKQKISERKRERDKLMTEEQHKEFCKKVQEGVQRSWQEGREVWNKDKPCTYKEKVSEGQRRAREEHPWSNGLELNLTLEDFKPFLDKNGDVKQKEMSEARNISRQTIYSYMKKLGLKTSYLFKVEQTKQLWDTGVYGIKYPYFSRQDLKPFFDKRGRVMVEVAARGLNTSNWAIYKSCKKLSLEGSDNCVAQRVVNNLISKVLQSPGKLNKRFNEIRNPKTGCMFIYDGYFPKFRLLVEYHGEQHFKFPNYWHKTIEQFKEYQEHDRFKEKRAKELGFKYLMIRYDEPKTEEHIRKRLKEIGVLKSKSEGLRILATLFS